MIGVKVEEYTITLCLMSAIITGLISNHGMHAYVIIQMMLYS